GQGSRRCYPIQHPVQELPDQLRAAQFVDRLQEHAVAYRHAKYLVDILRSDRFAAVEPGGTLAARRSMLAPRGLTPLCTSRGTSTSSIRTPYASGSDVARQRSSA